ncbi:AAA family ATPase [Hyalangium versicolor]|uniref:AAA family ATPase n=1 Tax=Hyalangium versicolor TaxID=2861190 RepID=UPI001CCD2C8F|nr:AAA family ATPase [Hyalangium versicolor]
MAFTLTVRNFRGLRHVEWSPSGVCALVGPNGSGKTTLIDALQILQDTRAQGFPKAIEEHGGAYGLRTFGVPESEPVMFQLLVGKVAWEFSPRLSMGPGGAQLIVHERLSDGNSRSESESLWGPAEKLHLDSPSLSFNLAWEKQLEPLKEVISGYRHYRHYVLPNLRREGSRLGGDLRLTGDGGNLFTVLMNWRNRRDHKDRLDFVTRALKQCFPGLFADFSFPIAANIVACEVHSSSDTTLIPSLLPDGFLVMLLHLCAIASTPPGGTIAIDEPENALHPFAIRRLMDASREWSDKHGVTVLLATHSPVILDTFKELPDKVFVMEPGHEVLPVSLERIKGRDWLAHFSLGDLYEHLEYGAPTGVDEA